MKITDILEMLEPAVSKKRYNGTFVDTNHHEYDEANKGKEGGRGVFSNVRADKKDPHMMRKNHHGPVTVDMERNYIQDGYVGFINHLIENKLVGQYVNLPRVYDIKELTDKQGKKVFTYTIEKLLSHNDISEKELVQVIENTLDHVPPTLSDDYSSHGMNRWFGDELESAIFNNYRHVIDEEMKKSLQVIRDIVKANGHEMSIDLNSGNIMYRRTPYGLQAVLSDPLV